MKSLSLIRNVEGSELRAFLLAEMAHTVALQAAFLQRFGKKSRTTGENQFEFYRGKVQDIFDTYADYDGFMDYEVTGEFEADMTDYLATEGENLIASRNFAAAFELGQASYELLHEIDIDDSNGVMLTILTYITENCGKKPWNLLLRKT